MPDQETVVKWGVSWIPDVYGPYLWVGDESRVSSDTGNFGKWDADNPSSIQAWLEDEIDHLWPNLRDQAVKDPDRVMGWYATITPEQLLQGERNRLKQMIDVIVDHLEGHLHHCEVGFYDDYLDKKYIDLAIESYRKQIAEFRRLLDTGTTTMSPEAITARYQAVMNEISDQSFRKEFYEAYLAEHPLPERPSQTS